MPTAKTAVVADPTPVGNVPTTEEVVITEAVESEGNGLATQVPSEPDYDWRVREEQYQKDQLALEVLRLPNDTHIPDLKALAAAHITKRFA